MKRLFLMIAVILMSAFIGKSFAEDFTLATRAANKFILDTTLTATPDECRLIVKEIRADTMRLPTLVDELGKPIAVDFDILKTTLVSENAVWRRLCRRQYAE